jgi:UDP-glucose 4-epimerase
MAILITGAAGFIGSSLARALLATGERVIGFDNLSLGTITNLEEALRHPNFSFEKVDLADLESYRGRIGICHASDAIREIWHLAASSNIPAGVLDSRVDLRDTFMTTFNTLLVMKELRIGTIVFASTSAVYGDLGDRPLTEDVGPLFPISNYGAMKLGCEALISAALESNLRRAFVFRFPNVIGVPATHGVILDFITRLKSRPDKLDVLGDGTQQKSYLHVSELVDAMRYIRAQAPENLAYYNIGPNDNGVTVRFIAERVVENVAPQAHIIYGTGNKGWVGDVPKFIYSTAKLEKLGWRPKLDSARAIEKAVAEVARQVMK